MNAADPDPGLRELPPRVPHVVVSVDPVDTTHKNQANIDRAMTALLIEWKDMAIDFSWMHHRSSELYNMLNWGIVLFTMAMSITSGALSFVLASNRSHSDHEERDSTSETAMQVSSGILALTSGALTTVQNSLNLSRRSEQHKATSDDFEKLAREIAVAILLTSTNEKTYASLAEYIKECNDRFNRLMERAPSLSDSLYSAVDVAKLSVTRTSRSLPSTLSQSYNQSYNQGHNQGHIQGHNQGHIQGHNHSYTRRGGVPAVAGHGHLPAVDGHGHLPAVDRTPLNSVRDRIRELLCAYESKLASLKSTH
jgi:hypothetical protein